jgi:hypothetical protein
LLSIFTRVEWSKPPPEASRLTPREHHVHPANIWPSFFPQCPILTPSVTKSRAMFLISDIACNREFVLRPVVFLFDRLLRKQIINPSILPFCIENFSRQFFTALSSMQLASNTLSHLSGSHVTCTCSSKSQVAMPVDIQYHTLVQATAPWN